MNLARSFNSVPSSFRRGTFEAAYCDFVETVSVSVDLNIRFFKVEPCSVSFNVDEVLYRLMVKFCGCGGVSIIS